MNYCQVVEMTDEQKREMYRKCTKEKLIGFLIQKEKEISIINSMIGVDANSAVITTTTNYPDQVCLTPSATFNCGQITISTAQLNPTKTRF